MMRKRIEISSGNVYSAEDIREYISQNNNSILLSESIGSIFNFKGKVEVIKIEFLYLHKTSRTDYRTFELPSQKTELIYAEEN